MKIRSGFVSNSSSSSFIIAVPNKATECKCCHKSNAWILQAISRYIVAMTKEGNRLYQMDGKDQIEQHFRDELQELEKSKRHAEEQIKLVENLQKEPSVYESYMRLKRVLELDSYKLRPEKEPEAVMQERLEKSLADRKARFEKHLSEYETKHKALKELISKITSFTKKNHTVYSFTIDNWSTETESAIQRMIADKEVEVLYCLRT